MTPVPWRLQVLPVGVNVGVCVGYAPQVWGMLWLVWVCLGCLAGEGKFGSLGPGGQGSMVSCPRVSRWGLVRHRQPMSSWPAPAWEMGHLLKSLGGALWRYGKPSGMGGPGSLSAEWGQYWALVLGPVVKLSTPLSHYTSSHMTPGL